jgi:hypothetical protein
VATPTVTASYNVTVGQLAYTGAITVLITDVHSATIYSGPLQYYSTPVYTSLFPISITVTPASGYQVYTQTGIIATNAVNM